MNEYDQQEVERQRLYKLIDQALDSIYDDDPERPPDLRLDSALIVLAHIWGTEDGEDGFEGIGVYSESKKQYVVRGLLERGIDRVTGASESGEAW